MLLAYSDDVPFDGYEFQKLSLDYLYVRARGKCFVCKEHVPREQASREHILPVSLGGTHDESNLSISHKTCNHKRGNGYKSFYSQHHRVDMKHYHIIEDYNILVQIVPDADGFYLILGKKNGIDKK